MIYSSSSTGGGVDPNGPERAIQCGDAICAWLTTFAVDIGMISYVYRYMIYGVDTNLPGT